MSRARGDKTWLIDLLRDIGRLFRWLRTEKWKLGTENQFWLLIDGLYFTSHCSLNKLLTFKHTLIFEINYWPNKTTIDMATTLRKLSKNWHEMEKWSRINVVVYGTTFEPFQFAKFPAAKKHVRLMKLSTTLLM